MEQSIFERMNAEKKESLFFRLLIIWTLYPIVLWMISDCPLWMEREEDGWYIYIENGDYDDAGDHSWKEIYDGPLYKTDAQAIINNCEAEGEAVLDKYGTFYSYLWKFNDNVYSQVIRALITLIILLGPWWVFHKKYPGVF